MHKRIIIFFTLLLSVFSSFIFAEEKTPRGKIFSEIMRNTIPLIEKKYPVNVGGTRGSLLHKLREVCLTVQYSGKISFDDARILYVNIAEEILNFVNARPHYKPYLINYPFELKNLDLSILFDDKKTLFPLPPNLCSVNNASTNSVRFNYYNLKNRCYDTSKRITEPYEEALKIVKSQNALITHIPLSEIKRPKKRRRGRR